MLQPVKLTSAPVVLIIYKRTDLLQRIVDVLNTIEIDTLFIVGDGPKGIPDEIHVSETRTLAESIKAKNVIRLYSPENIGVKANVSRGISEALRYSDRAIILEDDCLPNKEFFITCNRISKLLAADQSLAGFCGSSFLPGQKKQGVWRSRKFNVWGWMVNKPVWDSFLESGFLLRDSASLRKEVKHLRPLPLLSQLEIKRIIKRLDAIDTWDVQFETYCVSRGHHFIKPRQNLVQNIGFGQSATNTKNFGESLSLLAAGEAINLLPPLLRVNRLFDSIEAARRIWLLVRELFSKRTALPALARLKRNQEFG